MDDPRGILRAGTSVLKTWDFAFDEGVDKAGVGDYVWEAVARHGEYRANAAEVLAASRPQRGSPGRDQAGELRSLGARD